MSVSVAIVRNLIIASLWCSLLPLTGVALAGVGSGAGKSAAVDLAPALGTDLDPTLPVEVESTPRQLIGEGGEGWTARYLRAPQTVECLGRSDLQCREQRLEVTNEAKVDLLCKALVPTEEDGSDERLVLVPPGRKKTVAGAFLVADRTLKLRTVRCETLPVLPDLAPAPPTGCRPESIAGQGVEAFYPPLSRQLLEEGPVTVYFRLESAEGKATQLQVVQSSLSTQLDQAALLYVANQTFKTACPQHQFRLRVRFRIDD